MRYREGISAGVSGGAQFRCFDGFLDFRPDSARPGGRTRMAAITLVVGILRPEVFYTETNREIYAALQSMYHAGRVIDIMTIKEKFARRGKLEFIGGFYTN